jgi:hypothetical protein
MSDCGFHRVEDELGEGWVESFAGQGVAEIEVYLAKHAAFLAYLDQND